MSVIVWKNAQFLNYVTWKERKFPNEKENKAPCNRGKWDHFRCFRKQLLSCLHLPRDKPPQTLLILPLLRCGNQLGPQLQQWLFIEINQVPSAMPRDVYVLSH